MTTQPKHTSGPWEYQSVSLGYTIYATKPDSPNEMHKNQPIAFTQWANHEANARLIAAAPDLLETLKKIHGEMMVVFCSGDSRPASWFESRIKTIENAIAKAEGIKS